MRLLTLGLVVFLTTKLFSQDSLVRINEVRYMSEFEELSFKEYFSNTDEEYLSLFLSLDEQLSQVQKEQISTKISDFVREIRSTNYLSKKPQKQIKSIYQKIHDTFLRKYVMENRFHEIFVTGNYNCVTATALYSIIFEQLNIPYVIKEEPTHVYLVAYPDESNILVETTAPAYGFINFDQAYKNNFINNLKNQKIIGRDEIESSNIEHLFNKYYFSNENIDLKKLVGIHYMNDAIFLQEHGKVRASFEQAEKAYLFYPSKRCQYLIASFGALLVSSVDLGPLDKASLVAKLSRYKSMGITKDMIKAEFVGITQEVMIKLNDKQLYRECYDNLVNGLNDSELINDITYYFNYENARIYYNQGDFESARNYFRKSLEIQPNNVDLGLIFSQCLSQSLKTQETSTSILDSMQLYRNAFPTLMEIQSFKTMMATAYLLEFKSLYDKGLASQGDKYKLLFEVLMNEDKKLFIHPDVVGLAYSTACTYYFKNGQKARARELVIKGLEYAPGNYELRVRQQMLAR